ncbi:MAG TPA: hypothetical protein VF135_06520, partial [Terriglobales bacterium]
MPRILRIGLLIAICVPAFNLLPGMRAALAIVVGEVSLNGNRVSASTAVLEGDRLRTGTDSALVLQVVGSTIRVDGNSEVRYRPDGLELVSGTLQVSGRERVILGQFKASPLGSAKFRAKTFGARSELSVLTGKVRVSSAHHRTIEVEKDHTWSSDG